MNLVFVWLLANLLNFSKLPKFPKLSIFTDYKLFIICCLCVALDNMS